MLVCSSRHAAPPRWVPRQPPCPLHPFFFFSYTPYSGGIARKRLLFFPPPAASSPTRSLPFPHASLSIGKGKGEVDDDAHDPAAASTPTCEKKRRPDFFSPVGSRRHKATRDRAIAYTLVRRIGPASPIPIELSFPLLSLPFSRDGELGPGYYSLIVAGNMPRLSPPPPPLFFFRGLLAPSAPDLCQSAGWARRSSARDAVSPCDRRCAGAGVDYEKKDTCGGVWEFVEGGRG